jgi:hypothetical protein
MVRDLYRKQSGAALTAARIGEPRGFLLDREGWCERIAPSDPIEFLIPSMELYTAAGKSMDVYCLFLSKARYHFIIHMILKYSPYIMSNWQYNP